MSLFRKPKKIQRRVFSSNADEDDNTSTMDVDGDLETPPPPIISLSGSGRRDKDKSKKSNKPSEDNGVTTAQAHNKPKALLSFADDEDDGEVFQVRKSSHSKKVMRMLDKERRKKKREERAEHSGHSGGVMGYENGSTTTTQQQQHLETSSGTVTSGVGTANSSRYKSASSTASDNPNVQSKSKKCDNDMIQTEIRTDDFVLVVKKSETPDVVLNGRAALCAGRDDVSDDEGRLDDDGDSDKTRHRFSKPEHLKQMLESGSIPDAAMIHAARKRRQRAREQGAGDYIPIEEPKEPPKLSSRLPREDVEGDQSDDEERMDMNDITGRKEREERREQFYAVENDLTEEDSDREMHEWENQQIRKGVTGAQLVHAQHETVLSRFMIKPAAPTGLGSLELEDAVRQVPPSTSTLLEQAYAKNAIDKTSNLATAMRSSFSKPKKEKAKPTALRTPQEMRTAITTRINELQDRNDDHSASITRIANELKALKLQELECQQNAPTAAAKYKFYQEIKCYVNDLVDCLAAKSPQINDLEKRALQQYGKSQRYLVNRRRQDVRDQAKEMAEASKSVTAAVKRTPEYEEQVRRAAEREGRRTRRRCDRERNDLLASHLDGMSSDDEIADQQQEQCLAATALIEQQAAEAFEDVVDDFCKIELILIKFYAWRKTDMSSYQDAFVSLCLPKLLAPLVRHELLLWSPLLQEYTDIETMHWYQACMLYAFESEETIERLKQDPDINLVPSLIEKIVLPKVNCLVAECWDPLSTTQTLRLIGFINRLGREFPLLSSNKQLRKLFESILDRMRLALENDVFIPIFPKQVQEAKGSFFQRQFCSGLKLFRNFLSWQGILADKPLRELAIGSLLNRYLLLAIRVCTPNDAIGKAYIIVNTLPTVWLLPNSDTLKNLELFITFIRQTLETCDANNPLFMQSCEKAKQILQRLHSL
ncbi:PAX3- and PAX7-binding protein 1 isoform X1 [Drosophila sulfurigaster albostrigata]|uniref:PAX3- and PAX7-binding protein 1 isoform X1 n=1 Tax=Drosophila sulfurigaster albostrigata TaxID=89887 RepID=UPI002D21BCAA|nr:PAX3- and PAX7-binding protein 1 isoform X1 [Drosophila sulfurigaster albostrigata]